MTASFTPLPLTALVHSSQSRGLELMDINLILINAIDIGSTAP